MTSEPIDAGVLREALGSDGVEDSEVLVVSPALTSPARFWLSDVDAAIEHAERVQEETVERLDEEGIDAAGDTGESDPLVAVEDALTTFDADRILVVTHVESERDYREDAFPGDLERRLGRPVEHRLVTR